jgi:hypothetical protein
VRVTVSVFVCSYFGMSVSNINVADPSGRASKEWVCDSSLARISGSNPAGSMGVCLL